MMPAKSVEVVDVHDDAHPICKIGSTREILQPSAPTVIDYYFAHRELEWNTHDTDLYWFST